MPSTPIREPPSKPDRHARRMIFNSVFGRLAQETITGDEFTASRRAP